MSKIVVDVRGLSCPQPVLETLNVIKKLPGGEVTVMVDTGTSRENVIRSAAGQAGTLRTSKKRMVSSILS